MSGETFEFTGKFLSEVERNIAKYPPERKQSAEAVGGAGLSVPGPGTKSRGRALCDRCGHADDFRDAGDAVYPGHGSRDLLHADQSETGRQVPYPALRHHALHAYCTQLRVGYADDRLAGLELRIGEDVGDVVDRREADLVPGEGLAQLYC